MEQSVATEGQVPVPGGAPPGYPGGYPYMYGPPPTAEQQALYQISPPSGVSWNGYVLAIKFERCGLYT
eukprot:365823-Chlamydomonas_euryale.AAC.7